MKIKIVMGLVWASMVLMAASAQAKDGSQGAIAPGLERATFAGGRFWCMESPFDKLTGVVSVTVGYTGGQMKNPTYKEVSAGGTGHAEAVEILYDPTKIAYEKLLDVFWRNIDPTVTNRQFCDVGNQYRSAIFYHTAEQRRLAEQSKGALQKTRPFRNPIVT
jgi:peptide-methionine (S)-S-oxide reductase